MDVSSEQLKARAADIMHAVEKTRQIATVPDQEFWADERNLYSIKFLLLQAMEAAGSICVHVMAKKFQVAASSYAACFEALADHGVIASDLSAKLRKMIRFRNLLVHRYWEIDDARILNYARENSEDLILFLQSIWHFLGWGPRRES